LLIHISKWFFTQKNNFLNFFLKSAQFNIGSRWIMAYIALQYTRCVQGRGGELSFYHCFNKVPKLSLSEVDYTYSTNKCSAHMHSLCTSGSLANSPKTEWILEQFRVRRFILVSEHRGNWQVLASAYFFIPVYWLTGRQTVQHSDFYKKCT